MHSDKVMLLQLNSNFLLFLNLEDGNSRPAGHIGNGLSGFPEMPK